MLLSRATYLDSNVKDLSPQIRGAGQKSDSATGFIDAEYTIVTCEDIV